jgi:hypothetical protein
MDGVDTKQPTTVESRRPKPTSSMDTLNALVQQYGCGPVRLTGASDALYERHLFFDSVADPATVGARDRYEALARSIRDILSQRWVLTEQTYERENPKRVYYLSMEFLIGRSLANNVTNLLVSPFVSEATKLSTRDWLGLLEAEPDAGLGNGGLGRLAACFLDSMATLQLPAMGYGLRYEYGIFRQSIERGWQREQPDNWLRRSDPWEVARSAGRGVRRQDHQHASALGGSGTRVLRFPGVQSRTVRQRGGRDACRRIGHSRAVSRRLHDSGSGTALRPGVLPGCLLTRRSGAPISADQLRLGGTS